MRCAVGCGLRQQSSPAGTGLDAVRGDPHHPVTAGLACERGIRETKTHAGERLTQPLIRRHGALVPTTWEIALSTVARAIATTSEEDPNAVAILGSGQQTNEAAYALGKLARGGIGTTHYDANTTLCMASAATAYLDAFGSDAPPPTYDDIPEATVHVVWGANPAVAHPVLFHWIRTACTASSVDLVVIDPIETETAAAADHHVAVEPGTDLSLARAILARLVETDRIADRFIKRYTTGFEAVRATLPEPERAAAAAGVSLATVDRLAAAFAHRPLVYWGMGINQSVRGTATAGALIDLCLATGTMGPGSGPFSLTGQANSMGARTCASKGTWPGHQPFDDPESRSRVARAWGVPTGRLPTESGPGPVGILEADPAVVWTVATNPAAGMPDATTVRRSLNRAFLVVQDVARTETVAHADVVLPAATWGETGGTTTNMERRISRVRSVTDPPGKARTDLRIIVELASRVAPGLFAATGDDPRAVFAEWTALTAGTPADCSGITMERLGDGPVRWPAPSTTDEGGYRYYDRNEDPGVGIDAESETWRFPTPSGRARFSTYTVTPDPEPTDEAFPLQLTTGREPLAYNTGIRSRSRVDSVARSEPIPARVAPDTFESIAASLDREPRTEPDLEAVLVTRRGRAPTKLRSDSTVPTGLVWLPIHHPETNELTVPATDPHSDEPHYKGCAVRVEPR